MKLVINNNEIEISMVNEIVKIGSSSRYSLSMTVNNPSIPVDSITESFGDFNEKSKFSVVDNDDNTTEYTGFSEVEIHKSNSGDSNFINITFSKK